MAVTIDIELQTADALSEIQGLQGAIKSLEDELDLDIDDDGALGEMKKNIEEFTTKVKTLRSKLDGLQDDLAETLESLDGTEISVDMPSGETGAVGGEGDPPEQHFEIRTQGFQTAVEDAVPDGMGGDDEGGFDAKEFAARIEDTYGLDPRAIRADLLKGFDGREFDSKVTRGLGNIVESADVGDLAQRAEDTPVNKGFALPGDLRVDDDEGVIAGDFGLGLESLQQQLTRLRELSPTELDEVLDGSLPDALSDVEVLEERYGMDFSDAISEREFIRLGIRTDEEKINEFEKRLDALSAPKFEADSPFALDVDEYSDRVEELRSRVDALDGIAGDVPDASDLFDDDELTSKDSLDILSARLEAIDEDSDRVEKLRSRLEDLDAATKGIDVPTVENLSVQDEDRVGKLQRRLEALDATAKRIDVPTAEDLFDEDELIDKSRFDILSAQLDAIDEDAQSLSQDELIEVGGLDPQNFDDVEMLNRRLNELGFERDASELFGIDFDKEANREAFDFFDKDSRRGLARGFLERLDLEDLNNGMSRFGDVLSRLKPSMRVWYNLIAAILPIMIVLGKEVLGVAAAFGALGVAGASILGLGLAGQAETMAGAMQNARTEVRSLKKDLFDVFQPVMGSFSPIQGQFFDFVPGEMQDVADAMEGLVQGTVFEDTLFEMFSLLTDYVAEFFRIIASHDQIISQLVVRFTQILGTGLLDFFEWLIVTTYRNQDLLVQLGVVLKRVAKIVFNLSHIIANLSIAFNPLLKILVVISSLLKNDIIAALFTFVAILAVTGYSVIKLMSSVWLLIIALTKLFGLLSLFGSGGILAGITSFFTLLWSYIEATIIALWQMEGAAYSAMAALAATGVGALVVGGGILASQAAGEILSGGRGTTSEFSGGGSGFGSSGLGGGTTIYNDNREFTIQNQGEMSTFDEQSLRDSIESINTQESNMTPPESPSTTAEGGSARSDNGGNGNGGGDN